MKKSTKKKSIDILEVFKADAIEIQRSRDDCRVIHETDIRASGNQVEIKVREYFKRMLPSKYYVTNGHLIDEIGNSSGQLDIIISDGFGLPSLLTTNDGTSYIPIDSTYAIGEIKSTYYKSESYISKFITQITNIKNNLNYKEIENTFYHGFSDKTIMRDTYLGKANRILNSLFTFMFFVDSGDFNYADIEKLLSETEAEFLPNIIVLLNNGIIFPGHLNKDDKTYFFRFYPEDSETTDMLFTSIPTKGNGSSEGNHLAFLYLGLINHLSNSYLEPPIFNKYISNILHDNPMKVQAISICKKN